ncbi:MAG: helix-turn-helix domain-containing protein [Mycetocola sp.]
MGATGLADPRVEPQDSGDEPIGARERRHRETATRITFAALELFEQNGSAHTTVDDIAARAGVSARTVFRYFRSKEHTVLKPEGLAEQQAVAALDAGILCAGVDGIVAQARRIVHEIDRDPIAREIIQRTRRLLCEDERLLHVAQSTDAELVEQLVELMFDRAGGALSRTRIRLALDAVSAIVRASLELWATGVEATPGNAVDRVAQEYRQMLVPVVPAVPADPADLDVPAVPAEPTAPTATSARRA